ncbi:hypothetical protein F5Y16DRAFT_374956 [Xylariaceae sp. FL0255]|nr:hypothetical protein F5Y16DRAFT_374956 [Xylariaceae sp. FL0255]
MWFERFPGHMVNRDLVRLLIVPLAPKPRAQSHPRPRDPTHNYTCEDKVLSKQLQQLQLPTSTPDQLGLLSLPTELHLLILSFLEEDIGDVICFCITNRHFWSMAGGFIDRYYRSSFGQLAGKSIIFLHNNVYPSDYPHQLFHTEDMESIRAAWDDAGGIQVDIRTDFKPWKNVFDSLDVKRIQDDLEELEALLLQICHSRGVLQDPAFHSIERDLLGPDEEAFFPRDEKWLLRNLDTKEFVTDAIAFSQNDTRGPHIDVLGFGEVVKAHIRWSRSASFGHNHHTRGVWVGHRFDITTLKRHEAETSKEEWRDVSKKMADDLVDIWSHTIPSSIHWLDFLRQRWNIHARKNKGNWK